jgi:hypothetical protein
VFFLAGALFAPAPARAGCGDHVVVIASPEKTPPLSAPAVPVAPAKKNAPCSGPHCSRAPLTPAPAPAVPVGPGGPEWAYLLQPLLLPSNYSTLYFWEAPREQPLFLASSVYHPPR